MAFPPTLRRANAYSRPCRRCARPLVLDDKNRMTDMTSTLPRALIYMTGRNCERYLRASIESVARQTHAAVHVLFIDDCSDDGSLTTARTLLATLLPARHTLVRNPQPWGKARNAHVHLRESLVRGDFVAVLDADDQLIRPTILAEMAAHYTAGYDVVWTTFETDTGHAGGSRPLDPLQPPRPQGWRTSHFFSFRAELFANVPESYLQDDNGRWFPAACDRAIALPILDQTRRYKFMPVSALRYTTNNPNSHHNRDPRGAAFSSREQSACAELIHAKPPLPCTRGVLGEHADGDEAPGKKVAAPAARAPAPAAPEALVQAELRADDVWSQLAAATLAQRCPALLELMMDGQAAPLALREAWRWWNWLQASGRAPAVLEIGAGPLAAPLKAMVHALGGRFLSACADRERAVALRARLESAGLAADVIHVPVADAAIDGHQGRIADLSVLPVDATGFDILLTSVSAPGTLPTESILVLPMAVDRLDPQGFRVCLWAPDEPALRKDVASAWSALVPELQFTDNAFAGQAVCARTA